LGGGGPNDDFGRDGVVLGLVFGVQINIGAGGADRLRAEDGGELGNEFGCDRVKSGQGDFPFVESKFKFILTAKKAISY
jgi:hypothetical protein